MQTQAARQATKDKLIDSVVGEIYRSLSIADPNKFNGGPDPIKPLVRKAFDGGYRQAAKALG